MTPATTTTLGGIKIGDTLQINNNNVANVSDEIKNHPGNTTVHITAAERQAWNAKQAALTVGYGLQMNNNEISLLNQIDYGSITAGVDEECDYGSITEQV